MKSMKRAIITIDEQGRVHFPNANADDIWLSTQATLNLSNLIIILVADGAVSDFASTA